VLEKNATSGKSQTAVIPDGREERESAARRLVFCETRRQWVPAIPGRRPGGSTRRERPENWRRNRGRNYGAHALEQGRRLQELCHVLGKNLIISIAMLNVIIQIYIYDKLSDYGIHVSREWDTPEREMGMRE
jgi:hypothetical protein